MLCCCWHKSVNFKTEIAEAFCKQGKTARKRKGRPSSTVEQDFEAKCKRGLPNQYLENLYEIIKLPIFQSLCKTKAGAKCQAAKALLKCFAQSVNSMYVSPQNLMFSEVSHAIKLLKNVVIFEV